MEKQYRIGVDLGGTNIKAGVVNAANEIVASHSVKTLPGRPYEEMIADMALAIQTALTQANIEAADCACIGIGSPGVVDSARGVVVFAANLQWDNVPVAQTLRTHFDLPVLMSNDANCAALGEVVGGAAKGKKNALMITLGTGVGGGVVMDGKIFEGGGPGGAELGHTVLVHGGEYCTCGRNGCFEAYSSASAIIREGNKKLAECPDSAMHKMVAETGRMTGRIPFDAARAGDAAGQAIVDDYIAHLGDGLVNMVNIFRPDIILLSGGVCNEGEYLTVPLNAYVRKYSFAGERVAIPPVVRAKLGNDAGLLGAANLG